ncbi:MAG: hypothetical protein O2960_09210 [Verrucomicrobia bacterium]|nr:hypothetical protein [Verrucomicrobiota bacterium]
MWLVVALILGLLPIAGYALGMQSVAARDPSSEWNVVQMFLSGGFVCAWAAGIAAAFVGVGWERRGTWVGRRSLSEFMGSIDDPISRRFHFGSPFRAQVWIEWRRNFRMPLLVWTLTIWISYSVVLTGTHFGLRIYVWDMIPVLATGFLFAGIAIIGLNTPRDAGSLRLSLSSFTATRPIDTETLVTAKLVAGAAAWGLAVSVLVISFGAALKMLGEFDQISSLDEAIMSQPGFLDQIPNLKEWIVVLAISLHLFVGILPLSASGKTPGFPWSIMPLILFYGGMMTLFEWAERDSSWHWDLCILLVGYVTLKLGVAFWAFRRSLERRLITQRFVTIYLVIWLSALI